METEEGDGGELETAATAFDLSTADSLSGMGYLKAAGLEDLAKITSATTLPPRKEKEEKKKLLLY